MIERLFVDSGLLALALAANHGHAAVLGHLVDRLHRARCGLTPDFSRNATGSGEHTRSPLLSINDMYRVEAPNVECAVKPKVRDAIIVEMVPEVVYLFHLLELALLDIETEAAVHMILGESFDRQQPGGADDERCSRSAHHLDALLLAGGAQVRRSADLEHNACKGQVGTDVYLRRDVHGSRTILRVSSLLVVVGSRRGGGVQIAVAALLASGG